MSYEAETVLKTALILVGAVAAMPFLWVGIYWWFNLVIGWICSC